MRPATVLIDLLGGVDLGLQGFADLPLDLGAVHDGQRVADLGPLQLQQCRGQLPVRLRGVRGQRLQILGRLFATGADLADLLIQVAQRRAELLLPGPRLIELGVQLDEHIAGGPQRRDLGRQRLDPGNLGAPVQVGVVVLRAQAAICSDPQVQPPALVLQGRWSAS